jgi:hypothetical protein
MFEGFPRGGAMPTFNPADARQQATWQLPWLRVSLILRRMVANVDCRDEDFAALLAMRRTLAQRGWFN